MRQVTYMECEAQSVEHGAWIQAAGHGAWAPAAGHGPWVQAAGRNGAWQSRGRARTRCMESESRDTEHGVQGAVPWALGMGFKAWGHGHEGFRGWDTGHGARGSGSGTQGSGLITDGWPDLFLDEFLLSARRPTLAPHTTLCSDVAFILAQSAGSIILGVH